MTAIPKDDFAFPSPETETLHQRFGLTKREYFAGLAMQSQSDLSKVPENLAHWSVKCADALIAELERTK